VTLKLWWYSINKIWLTAELSRSCSILSMKIANLILCMFFISFISMCMICYIEFSDLGWGIFLFWQETEVSAVKYIAYDEYKSLLAKEDSDYVPYDVHGQYGQLFDIIEKRYANV